MKCEPIVPYRNEFSPIFPGEHQILSSFTGFRGVGAYLRDGFLLAGAFGDDAVAVLGVGVANDASSGHRGLFQHSTNDRFDDEVHFSILPRWTRLNRDLHGTDKPWFILQDLFF